jgi:hypothetical protein
MKINLTFDLNQEERSALKTMLGRHKMKKHGEYKQALHDLVKSTIQQADPKGA